MTLSTRIDFSALLPGIAPPTLDWELRSERASSMGRAGRRIETALAALSDEPYAKASQKRTAAERDRLAVGLKAMGLSPLPSAANFVAVKTPKPAAEVVGALAKQGIMIVPVGGPPYVNHIRITIGSAASLGTVSGTTLGASSIVVSACGKGATQLTYSLSDGGAAGMLVDRVVLTKVSVSGSSWTSGTDCTGKTVQVALGRVEVLSRSITSGDIGGAGSRVLTLDVSDVTAATAIDFAVVIH
mgnify:CR=1 FL=1